MTQNEYIELLVEIMVLQATIPSVPLHMSYEEFPYLYLHLAFLNREAIAKQEVFLEIVKNERQTFPIRDLFEMCKAARRTSRDKIQMYTAILDTGLEEKESFTLMLKDMIFAFLGVVALLMMEFLVPNEQIVGFYSIIMHIVSIADLIVTECAGGFETIAPTCL